MDIFTSRFFIARFLFPERNKCVNFKTGRDYWNRNSSPGNGISKDNHNKTHQNEREE